VRIVNQAQQRLGFRNVGQQRQRGEADHEPVGGSAVLQAEDGGQSRALRCRQPIEMIQHRGTQLVQPAVRQLRL